MKRLCLLLAISLCGCAATCATGPQPIPPAPPVTDYAGVCRHLLDIGCGEGAEPNCATVMGQVDHARLTNLHLQCLLDAESILQARACGSVACE